MEPSSDRPLFSNVGRRASTGQDVGSRAFTLLIAVGVVVALGAFLVELGARPPSLRIVEVQLGLRPAPEGTVPVTGTSGASESAP